MKAGFLVIKGYLLIWEALLCFVWSGAVYAAVTLGVCIAGWALAALAGGRDRVFKGCWWASLLLAYGVMWGTWKCLA